jgi:hypothetical protein
LSSQNKTATAGASTGPVAVGTAIALIAVYIAMLAFLVTMRGDKQWDRLVYLLSGFEALVFTGAGALFGTTIQRSNIATARADAADAKQIAQAERNRADLAEKGATAGRALATAVQVKARLHGSVSAWPDGSTGLRGSRPEEEPASGGHPGADTDLAELAELAQAMLPDT